MVRAEPLLIEKSEMGMYIMLTRGKVELPKLSYFITRCTVVLQYRNIM